MSFAGSRKDGTVEDCGVDSCVKVVDFQRQRGVQ